MRRLHHDIDFCRRPGIACIKSILFSVQSRISLFLHGFLAQEEQQGEGPDPNPAPQSMGAHSRLMLRTKRDSVAALKDSRPGSSNPSVLPPKCSSSTRTP